MLVCLYLSSESLNQKPKSKKEIRNNRFLPGDGSTCAVFSIKNREIKMFVLNFNANYLCKFPLCILYFSHGCAINL